MADINNRHTLAVYIPVRNCAKLLGECLGHLQWADEIVVADASDNDDIKKFLTANYPKAKHFFDKTDDLRVRFANIAGHIESEYILCVDADEFYTPEGAREMLDALKKPCAFDGFEIPSVSYVFGTRIGEGATQLRLFRKNRAFFPMKDIHEMPVADGPVKRLANPYNHYNNPILGINAIKHFRYEANNAETMNDENLSRLSLDGLQPAKLRWLVFKCFLKLNWHFIRTYWSCRRFGFAGLCIAYTAVFQIIASSICPTEELRMRKGAISRDRRGYY